MISPRKSPRKSEKTIPTTKENETHPILARTQQTSLLLTLFGKPHDMTCPFIFIYGHAATGKTVTVNRLLKNQNLPFAWINCIEACNPRLVMEAVLNQLSESEPTPENKYLIHATCLNMSDFIRSLNHVVEEKYNRNHTVYLVFDNAERLRDMPAVFLAALIKLQELSQMNICVILISEIIWQKFGAGIYLAEPYVIGFPDYTKAETMEIMGLDRPPDILECFYLNYISLVLSMFFNATRNVQELRYVATSNFEHYYRPIMQNEASTKDTAKLWKHVEPYLSKSLNSVYLREKDSTSLSNNSLVEKPVSSTARPIFENRANVELPYYSKFLLIAAYIASYNPPSTDKKFFLKHHGKAFKKRKTAKKKINQHEIGPKYFPLSRLLAIFYSICDDVSITSSYLFSQISSLVTVNLISAMGGNLLFSPKFKCLVSLDFIINIAKNVQFDVLAHLCDFNH